MTFFYANDEHDREDLPWPAPADCWMWQVGGRWIAVVGDWHDDWWEGAGPEDIEARPGDWKRAIADIPTTGSLLFKDATGRDITYLTGS